MIILEGPDGGGKSTLFECLRTRFPGYDFLHSGGPVRNLADLDARIAHQHPRQVRDRHFCISEPIYGPLFNRPDLIGYNAMKSMLDQNPLVIFCFSPNDEMPPQTGEHDTPEHVAGLIANRAKILDAYRQLAASPNLPYRSIIYRWLNFDWVVEMALTNEEGYRR